MKQIQKQNQTIPIIIIAVVTVIFTVLSISYLTYIQKLTDENTLKNLSELTKQEVARIRKIINEENINNEKFEGIFAESLYNGEGYEYIINSNGEVVANSNNRENGYNLYNVINTLEDKTNQQKLNNMKEQIKKYQDGQVKYNVEGTYYYTSYNYLNINDWYLVIITKGSAIAEEYNKSLKMTFFVAIIINMMAVIVAIYIIILNKKKRRQLYQLAYIDSITGVGNKNYFIEKGTETLKKENKPYYLMIIDIDKFKTFNKKYGREKGDKVLKAIAIKLKEIIEENEIITRLANDIFGIIFLNQKDIDDIVGKINDEISNIKVDENEYKMLLSIGIYKIKDEDNDIFEILDKALIAHNMSKGNYNKRYFIYDDKIEEKMIKEHDIEMIMEEGLEKQEFKVFYQPKIDTKTGKIKGAEALVRWQREDRLIPPNEFIPIFEKNKFIIKLDKYIFKKVCDDIKDWKDRFNEKIKISVNVSKEHLLQEDFIEEYLKIASKKNIKPEEIELEITESAMVDEDFDMFNVFQKIKESGFKISIDDFGTGYSSLSMLQNMPIDVIKIDKSFINQPQILEVIMKLAKNMNLETVAEGIETSDQQQRLKKLEVDLLQGYYYSKPLEKSKFEKYWRINLE